MENYKDLIQRQLSFFRSGKTKDVQFRINALNKLKESIQLHEKEILQGLRDDLNKSEAEAFRTEIKLALGEIEFTLDHLVSWSSPKEVETPPSHAGAKSYIYPEPYGLALIIAPWNYPFQLAIAPLIGAIAAGNCAVIKPSELTPQTSGILATIMKETFPEEYICVVEGEVETSTALLKEKFDYIFFTGSTMVGRIVAEAAAKHLTPVTLELGGKSPCIIYNDADLEATAKRIVRGKFLNAGQTCVAPDYILVQRQVKEKLVDRLKEAIKDAFGEDISKNPDFPRIINEKHFNRLKQYLDNGNLVAGGEIDLSRLFIEPTLLDNISWEDPVMQDEIFGPILPILEYDDVSEIIPVILDRPKPLALYIFSESEAFQNNILNSISFGGGSINDTLSHMTSHYLPFGGVGESGVGAYHGKGSFDTFSHFKSILKR
ncbi:aldehyde dehydrogenase [Bacillus pseudomycoides]|uniref:aldehyde dehydrogenase n=1 Tax=Bacillus pseudomycoides TaxID=64104 RepID=UPI0030002F8B